MYETKDDIPEAIWEYVESWDEEEETNKISIKGTSWKRERQSSDT